MSLTGKVKQQFSILPFPIAQSVVAILHQQVTIPPKGRLQNEHRFSAEGMSPGTRGITTAPLLPVPKLEIPSCPGDLSAYRSCCPSPFAAALLQGSASSAFHAHPTLFKRRLMRLKLCWAVVKLSSFMFVNKRKSCYWRGSRRVERCQ